ncbi:MAG: transporter substrate-binding protein [Alphaproteobacteria bacterium]|nr:transporter substrate-binding protein [Alphaproteobacteria bacterium]
MVPRILFAVLITSLLLGCGGEKNGPIQISAIGSGPRLVNPSRGPLDPPSAYLIESAAQGLVRFDAGGEIEPALAQSWVISDDGLRYTFRIARGSKWQNGEPVTADQVVARLRAATAPSSRNPLKPLLGAIDEIVKMTDDVLEIDLKAPRPNFLQLLAQPELGMIRGQAGAGPYRQSDRGNGAVMLSLAPPDEEDSPPRQEPPLLLRGEGAALAVARFDLGESDLVIGGTVGDLPTARASDPPATALVFDPVDGLLGLAFTRGDGALATPEIRQALAMAIDRPALVQSLAIRGLQPRETLLPAGIEGLTPAAPTWAALALPDRRLLAQRSLKGQRIAMRVAMPDGPGYRLVFASLRRDWAAIGIDAQRVGPSEPADLRMIDEVAPATLASWYLRHFTCDRGPLCSAEADGMMDQARMAPNASVRRELLANADRLIAEAGLFVPLAAPIRWSLAAPRLNGFRPNAFGHHPAAELIAAGS